MKKILCFGEVLWDCLPTGRHPGGAPVNVAYHLARNGIEPVVVTAVGDDALGGELLAYLDAHGIGTRFITRHAIWPTGTVEASLDAQGNALYDIKTGVAWDHIALPAEWRALAPSLDGIVFGSLAQRSEENRAVLLDLLRFFPAALRVFDVNLRPPFAALEAVWKLAREAHVLKLNHEEASLLTSLSGEEKMARALQERTGCPTVCITCAERGAGLLRGGNWYFEAGQKTEVVDTVGAGDAFLARLIQGLLAGMADPRETLRTACRTGEWVASQKGAMPDYGSFELAPLSSVQ